MKKLALVALAIAFSAIGWSQNVRWDYVATTTQSTSGNIVPVYAIRNVPISFYTGCTSLPCSTPANVYPSYTSFTPCNNATQVVVPLSNTCQATSDPSGNFGGYFEPGNYQYTITYQNQVYGPYQFSTGGSGSATPCPSAFAVQIANQFATGLDCDPNIMINKTTHTLTVGPITVGNTVTVGPQSAISASWIFDWTSPTTALNSLSPIPFANLLGPLGNTNCLKLNGSGQITTVACAGSGTVISVGLTPTARILVSGSPVTTSGNISVDVNATGTGSKVASSTGTTNTGDCAIWNSAGDVIDSGTACPAGSTTDYYWTVPTACSTTIGQPVECYGTTTLPGAMPDASYQIFCQADIYSYSGQFPSSTCTLRDLYPLPTAMGATISFAIVQIMQNGGGGGTYNVYFHAHHN